MSDDDDMTENDRIDRLVTEAQTSDPYPKPPDNVTYIGPGWDDEERLRVIEAENRKIRAEQRDELAFQPSDDPFTWRQYAPEIDEPEESRQPIQLLTIGQVESIETESPYLGDALLHPGGKVVMFGPPKSGKSQLAIDMMLNAACGGTWMGLQFDRPHKVIYCNAEIRAEYLHVRFDKIMPTFDAHQQEMIRKNFLITGRGDISLKLDRERIAEMVAAVDPTFLVLDPLSQFIEGIDENANAEMRDLFTATINPLVEADGGRELCLILVHHAKKGGANQGFDAIRGASYLRGWYDTGIDVKPKSPHTELRFETRNGPPPPNQLVEMDEETMRFKLYEADVGADFRHEVMVKMAQSSPADDGWWPTRSVGVLMVDVADEQELPVMNERQIKTHKEKLKEHPHVTTIGDKSGMKFRINDTVLDLYGE